MCVIKTSKLLLCYFILQCGCVVMGDDNEIVRCWDRSTCNAFGGERPPTSTPATRRQCCVEQSSGLAFTVDGDNTCYRCIVVGFSKRTMTMVEGRSQSVSVGYTPSLRAAEQNLTLNFLIELGTASFSDFLLSTTSVTIPQDDPSPQTVLIHPIADGVAMETPETATLHIKVADSMQPVFVSNSLQITITDLDIVEFFLTQDDYRAVESEEEMPIKVGKNRPIATPAILRVAPLTTQASGVTLPPNLPEDNQFSPNRANTQDFDVMELMVRFEADEGEDVVMEQSVPVRITDDNINEASEQYFVVTLEFADSTNSQNAQITRNLTLCKIADDDPIRIGFEQPRYAVTEDNFPVFVNDVTFAKENDQPSEQTFTVVITFGVSADISIQTASHGQENDFNSDQLMRVQRLSPDSNRDSVAFSVNPDDAQEGTEAFQMLIGVHEDSPVFLPPSQLFPITTVFILDNDLDSTLPPLPTTTVVQTQSETTGEMVASNMLPEGTTPPPPGDTASTLTTGAIVGIAVAGCVLLLLLLVAVVCLIVAVIIVWTKKRKTEIFSGRGEAGARELKEPTSFQDNAGNHFAMDSNLSYNTVHTHDVEEDFYETVYDN